jgi:hypothetical protein
MCNSWLIETIDLTKRTPQELENALIFLRDRFHVENGIEAQIAYRYVMDEIHRRALEDDRWRRFSRYTEGT